MASLPESSGSPEAAGCPLLHPRGVGKQCGSLQGLRAKLDEKEGSSVRHLEALSTLRCSHAPRARVPSSVYRAGQLRHPHPFPGCPPGPRRFRRSARGCVARLCPRSEASPHRHRSRSERGLTRAPTRTCRVPWAVGAAGKSRAGGSIKYGCSALKTPGFIFIFPL